MPVRDRAQRQFRRHETQVERAFDPEHRGALHRPGEMREPTLHLGTGTQIRHRGRGEPAVHLVQAPAGADRGHRRRQPPLVRLVIVHIPRRDRRQPQIARDPGQHIIVPILAGHTVIQQLNRHMIAAEPVGQPPQLLGRRLRPPHCQRVAHQALATPGQDQHVPGQLVNDLVQVIPGLALALPTQMRR